MKSRYQFSLAFVVATILITLFPLNIFAQKFIHPGIDQNVEDLALMKKKVLAGGQPWKGAYDKLKGFADSGFEVKPHAHVLRGPYGKPNIGGDDLSKSANMAYNY